MSEQVQALESRLQEVMGQQTTSDKAIKEEQVDELVVEISDLRVRLAEAKGEKEETDLKLEAVQEEQRKMKQWIENLDKMISVRESCMCFMHPSLQVPYSMYYKPMGDSHTSALNGGGGGGLIIRSWLVYEYTIIM